MLIHKDVVDFADGNSDRCCASAGDGSDGKDYSTHFMRNLQNEEFRDKLHQEIYNAFRWRERIVYGTNGYDDRSAGISDGNKKS